MAECLLCTGPAGDPLLSRIEAWSDERWRLTVSLDAEVAGLSYLEPRRHIETITDLEGREAEEFGEVLARCARALEKVTRCQRVYVYVFGDGVPHLHVHLAPHSEGDALNDSLIKGPIIKETLPGGATRATNPNFPPLDEAEQRTIANLVGAQLAPGPSGGR